MSRLTLNDQITRFIKSGFKKHFFTHDLYEFLYLKTNSFIAHHDRDGFYTARFVNRKDFDLTLIILKESKVKEAKHFMNEVKRFGVPTFIKVIKEFEILFTK